jgi:heat shock protein HslJ
MKKLIAMLFALALVSSSVAFAECKPADDKKMDKMDDKAKAKKHHKHHKKEKMDKMDKTDAPK